MAQGPRFAPRPRSRRRRTRPSPRLIDDATRLARDASQKVREKCRSLVHRAGGGMEQLIGADWGDFARTANGAFLLAFPSLFSIINPIGGAFIFYGVTRDFSAADKEKAAALVGLYS